MTPNEIGVPGASGGDACPRQSALSTLLVGISHGDRDALSVLYDAFGQAIYAFGVESGLGPARSAAATLDVFVQVWAKAANYDARAQTAWTWLRALALKALDDSKN